MYIVYVTGVPHGMCNVAILVYFVFKPQFTSHNQPYLLRLSHHSHSNIEVSDTDTHSSHDEAMMQSVQTKNTCDILIHYMYILSMTECAVY